MNVIIIGATSGIGKALALKFSEEGFMVGITGRRMNKLKEVQGQIKGKSYVKCFDVSVEDSDKALLKLIKDMGGVDIIVICAGVGYLNKKFDLKKELETIDVNCVGFVRMSNVAYHYFKKKGVGHIVGISSISSIRGGVSSSYSATKAFVVNYLEGFRMKGYRDKFNLIVTDICPGFVDTKMAKGEGLFWVASKEKVASQIFDAIRKKKKKVYVTKRWGLIAFLMKILPFGIYNRM